MTTKTIDLNRFKNAVGFTTTLRAWGNRRQGSLKQIQTDADKARLRLTKELILAKEFDEIISFLAELRKWIYLNTVPSFFKEGFCLTGLDGIEPIEARMRKAQGELASLVSALVNVYPARIIEARDGVKDADGKVIREGLGELFNPADYPDIKQLPGLFSISWNWISFTVPEGLPAELRKAEQDKLEAQFADAGEQITNALRVGFQELITHAVEKLTVEPGAKPKVFRDTLIGNIQSFIDTFSQRNLLNDVELADLVSKAKSILQGGVSAKKIRDYANVKENVREQFAGIKSELDKMIVERPIRKFDFAEE